MFDIEFENELARAIQNWKEWRDSQIRIMAYLKWETAGRPDGRSEEFWLEAEKEWWENNRIEIKTENIPSRIEVTLPPVSEFPDIILDRIPDDVVINLPPIRCSVPVTIP